MTVSPAARRKARHYAMQALYQWQMTSAAINVIEAEFHTDNDMSKVDTDYFRELLHKIPQQLSDLDGAYTGFLQERDADELDPITQALLRLATYELKERIDVPYKVVINEAVSLAKKFGATDSHKFINGVLDKVAEKHRAVEVQATRKSSS
ncbi:transcription antitermination factor NusB [Pseudomaricurvus alkylphenolicus]|uniref:transcription antitermination factor NusB n=1 Tax=Pseudomaricurvus alkylphenolicus TaxID=1306991 RepID=UPI001421A261|nr:transcription antitermination factor NusB [Pseudomaricurvus alkylphenolicus]NIB39050.1 transcription antitermination factor NusB [Pseudomaricurvus alkylphenolicus]